jgi:hypothetical protein
MKLQLSFGLGSYFSLSKILAQTMH